MARKTGKLPIPTSIAMMPTSSQFAFLAMATLEMAQDTSSDVFKALETIRRPLRESGYTPLPWDPKVRPQVPGPSLLTPEETSALDASPFWDEWDQSAQADKWVIKKLLSDPDRSRPIAWYLLQSSSQVKEFSHRWFPAGISYWASPFPASTAAELWVIFLAAFKISPDDVEQALQRAGSQLLSPIFYPQALPAWQLLEGFFNTLHSQLNNLDITIDVVRQTFDEAERQLRTTISELDSRTPALYLRITPALSQREAKETIDDLYTQRLPTIWHNTPSKPTINPTQKGVPPWWQSWETILSRAHLYAEHRWNNLSLQQAASNIDRAYSETGASDLKKEIKAFESVLELAANTIKGALA